MTKSDKIEHLSLMIRINVDHAISANLNEGYGYLEQLKKVADEGGFAMPETYEALGLARAAEECIRLANEISAVRDKLVENSFPKLQAVS